jgi:hypothetical protein
MVHGLDDSLRRLIFMALLRKADARFNEETRQ